MNNLNSTTPLLRNSIRKAFSDITNPKTFLYRVRFTWFLLRASVYEFIRRSIFRIPDGQMVSPGASFVHFLMFPISHTLTTAVKGFYDARTDEYILTGFYLDAMRLYNIAVSLDKTRKPAFYYLVVEEKYDKKFLQFVPVPFVQQVPESKPTPDINPGLDQPHLH